MADLPPGLLMQLASMLMGGKDTPGGQKFGGGLFGGNRFGGNTFGGNKFGGGKFGASAPQEVAVKATPPALPAFEQPGGSLPPIESYAPKPTPQAPMQLPPVNVTAPMPQEAPPMAQPQADATTVPPMPPTQTVRDDVMRALEQMRLAGKLPEQWKGAFSPGYGETL